MPTANFKNGGFPHPGYYANVCEQLASDGIVTLRRGQRHYMVTHICRINITARWQWATEWLIPFDDDNINVWTKLIINQLHDGTFENKHFFSNEELAEQAVVALVH